MNQTEKSLGQINFEHWYAVMPGPQTEWEDSIKGAWEAAASAVKDVVLERMTWEEIPMHIKLSGTHEAVSAKISGLESTVTALQKIVQARDTELNDLKKCLQKEARITHEQTEEINELFSVNTQVAGRIREAQSEMETMVRKNERLETQNRYQEEIVKQRGRELDQLRDKNAELKSALTSKSTVEASWGQLKTDNCECRKEIQFLKKVLMLVVKLNGIFPGI